MKPVLFLDRAAFQAWTQGTLISFAYGEGVVNDNEDHERAAEVLEDGGRVVLTVAGKPVSEMVRAGSIFAERFLCSVDARDLQTHGDGS